jgi:hypothetical protein
MKIGMLWFDNDKQTDLTAKIESASQYYFQKYGKLPNICFVHPSMLPKKTNSPENQKESASYKAGNVEVKSNQSVLPNHLWIGINGVNGKTTP